MQESLTLKEVFRIIQKRLILIISIFIISTGITAFTTFYLLPNVYQAQTQILVNQSINNEERYSWAQLETDLQLIDTYSVIIKSPIILTAVIEELNLNWAQEQLSKQISVENEDNSKVVNVIVESKDPQQSVDIANTITNVFKEEIPILMSIDNITILSEAKLSDSVNPIKPNKLLNIMIAAIISLMGGVGLAFFIEAFNTTVKSEKDIEELINLPVIGIVSLIKHEKKRKTAINFKHKVEENA